LPELPNSLLRLYCSANDLTYLPELPEKLIELFCSKNPLKTLQILPKNLKRLCCKLNILSEEINDFIYENDICFNENDGYI